MAVSGNIRVLCRVKPVLKEDQHEEGQSVVVATDPNNESSLTVISKGKGRIFELDKVFQPQATQEEVGGRYFCRMSLNLSYYFNLFLLF